MKCARLVLSVVAAGLLVAPASAAIVNPVMDFGIGYAKEGTRVADDHTSTSGDVLTIVGHVVQFQEPFDDLDPNDPNKEYTYVYTGMVSQGTAIQPAGSFTFYNTDYTGGTLSVYCDTAQDADFANMTGFDNGDLILQANVGTLST
ncbi:MAG: hypothetical protein HKN21_05880, partial [Candidatus Eisenbacteria bacterium]|nr:hypothetical protein [Candidatus Eisenbacteria bacterium]